MGLLAGYVITRSGCTPKATSHFGVRVMRYNAMSVTKIARVSESLQNQGYDSIIERLSFTLRGRTSNGKRQK